MFGISSEKSHIHKKERTWNTIKIFQKIPKKHFKIYFIFIHVCIRVCMYAHKCVLPVEDRRGYQILYSESPDVGSGS